MHRKLWFFAIALLAVMACSVGKGVVVNISFENLFGLAKDDRVLFEGNPAGSVTSVQYNQDGSYTVQIEVEQGFAMSATEYSQFRVLDDPGLQGRKSIHIELTRQGGAPLVSGTNVVGIPPEDNLATKLEKELESGLDYLKEKIETFGRDLKAFPESQEYKDLKRSLEELGAELERKEKKARERFKREMLPKIQRELDNLRERLKKMGREKEIAPLDREMDRIRKI